MFMPANYALPHPHPVELSTPGAPGRLAGIYSMTAQVASPRVGGFADAERRVEGREKVSGRAAFTADIRRPNMLWAAFAVADVAHGRIVSIDVSAAREVPGVRAILTGKDIGPRRFGRTLMDWPATASGSRRWQPKRARPPSRRLASSR
jgi:xanthine dehydrogenase molybdopterin-binding subunit B